MKLKITRAELWAASLEDRPASLAEKLQLLQQAGADLAFIMARRAFEKPGTGVVFLSPIKGARQTKAASVAGFHRTEALHSVRIEGADRPGLAWKVTHLVASAGINLRGFSASVIGKRFVAYLALDDEEDALNAAKALKRL